MEKLRRAVTRRLHIKNTYLRIAMAEFLGTSVAVVIGDGSLAQMILSKEQNGNVLTVNLAWCLGIALGAYISGGVSGAHLNPAVTVTMSLLGKIPWTLSPVYLTAQYSGAFFGAFVVYVTYYEALLNFDGGERYVDGPNGTAGIFATYPADHVGMAQGLFDQAVGTALLMICIMAVVDERNLGVPRHVAPLVVGLAVLAIGTSLGYNCGYAINPARDLSPRIFTAIAGWGTPVFSYNEYKWFWIPVVGPHLGSLAGALIYNLAIGCHWPDIAGPEPCYPPRQTQPSTSTEPAKLVTPTDDISTAPPKTDASANLPTALPPVAQGPESPPVAALSAPVTTPTKKASQAAVGVSALPELLLTSGHDAAVQQQPHAAQPNSGETTALGEMRHRAGKQSAEATPVTEVSGLRRSTYGEHERSKKHRALRSKDSRSAGVSGAGLATNVI